MKEHLACVLVGELAQLDYQLDAIQLEGGLGAIGPDIAVILMGSTQVYNRDSVEPKI